MSKYDLIFIEEVNKDVLDAYLWYEDQREGLGDEFLESLEEGYTKISKNPYFYQVKFENKRTLKIKRFPYLIIYEIEENSVIVYAVFQASRDPLICKDR